MAVFTAIDDHRSGDLRPLTFHPQLFDAPLDPGGLEPQREAEEQHDSEEEDLPGILLDEVAEGEQVGLALGAQPQCHLVPGGLALKMEKKARGETLHYTLREREKDAKLGKVF